MLVITWGGNRQLGYRIKQYNHGITDVILWFAFVTLSEMTILYIGWW